MLEVRTLMITYFVSSLMNAVVMAVFWKMERQYHKGLSLYFGLQMWFTYIHPSTSVRIMLIAAFVSIPVLQSGSLLLGNRGDVSQRHTRFPGILSLSYVLLQSLRIVSEAFRPTGNLFSPGSFSSIVALVLQYMTVGFILSLIVMVHQDNLGTLGKREIDLMKNKKILQDFIDFTNDWEYSIHADGRLQ